MRARLRRRFVLVLATCTLLASDLPAMAHPRPYPHVHRRGVVRLRVRISEPRPLPRPIVVDGVRMGSVDFDVRPDETQVFVNGTLQGRVGDFDGRPRTLHLPSGAYRVTLKTPDGERWSERIRVTAGQEINLNMRPGR